MKNIYHALSVAITGDDIGKVSAFLSLFSTKEIKEYFEENLSKIIEQDNVFIFNTFFEKNEDHNEFDFLIKMVNSCFEEDSINIYEFILSYIGKNNMIYVLKKSKEFKKFQNSVTKRQKN